MRDSESKGIPDRVPPVTRRGLPRGGEVVPRRDGSHPEVSGQLSLKESEEAENRLAR